MASDCKSCGCSDRPKIFTARMLRRRENADCFVHSCKSPIRCEFQHRVRWAYAHLAVHSVPYAQRMLKKFNKSLDGPQVKLPNLGLGVLNKTTPPIVIVLVLSRERAAGSSNVRFHPKTCTDTLREKKRERPSFAETEKLKTETSKHKLKSLDIFEIFKFHARATEVGVELVAIEF